MKLIYIRIVKPEIMSRNFVATPELCAVNNKLPVMTYPMQCVQSDIQPKEIK